MTKYFHSWLNYKVSAKKLKVGVVFYNCACNFFVWKNKILSWFKISFSFSVLKNLTEPLDISKEPYGSLELWLGNTWLFFTSVLRMQNKWSLSCWNNKIVYRVLNTNWNKIVNLELKEFNNKMLCCHNNCYKFFGSFDFNIFANKLNILF